MAGFFLYFLDNLHQITIPLLSWLPSFDFFAAEKESCFQANFTSIFLHFWMILESKLDGSQSIYYFFSQAASCKKCQKSDLFWNHLVSFCLIEKDRTWAYKRFFLRVNFLRFYLQNNSETCKSWLLLKQDIKILLSPTSNVEHAKNKALVSARWFGLSACASGAQILISERWARAKLKISERKRKFALIFDSIWSHI